MGILSRINRFFQPGADAPAVDHWALTPSDGTNEAQGFRAIYVGAGGNITVVSPNGNAVQYLAVPQGTVLPVEGIRVNTTGTSASSLVGLA
jgi:hypothetical protein